MKERVYLDHNATTPLRAEARTAMLAAMDLVGNPSSVHGEGRAAKAVVERARAQVAGLVGCEPSQVIFTSGATEAAALAVAQRSDFAALPTEHDCLAVWGTREVPGVFDSTGAARPEALAGLPAAGLLAVALANSETGICAPKSLFDTLEVPVVCDITQAAGRVAVPERAALRADYMILSAHKLGGPKGVGALINFTGSDPEAILRGGGQEMGRRSGTENIIGIAGFGAAAEGAAGDIRAGRWDAVGELRKILENTLAAEAKTTIFVGQGVARLPNTSLFATPGWKGEAQVIQMDLAGFAISAGSACSSGKVRASAVLRSMGFEEDIAGSAVRVSLGLETTRQDVERFAAAWLAAEARFRARAA
ncbi:aminotransferase class V-fold PLP-dependent enzyme [uncultured Roseobacter sp.]|uniref:cysteine desulfurase family protein n=1 Tax=uncultured Roseobacter sp. TaxID=114847 RepID=UPI002619550B|nr:aminotransferase class V-fold PLP-dependent enzyme [uncultured Roseobacter sp.]